MQQLLERIARLRLLVLGDAMLDHYLWGDASRISPEAPVPVVKVERDSFTAGGAANVALNLRALGVSVELAATAGADSNGDALRDILKRHQIEPDPLLFAATRPTIVKTRVMCRNQQLCRLDREAAPAAYRLPEEWLEQRLPALLQRVDAVIISDYAKGVVNSELISKVQLLAQPGKLIALDPKPRTSLSFKGLGLITPNRAEAMQLAQLHERDEGGFPEVELCRRIHTLHAPALLVVTLGADGMLISYGNGRRQRIPTAARAVFDVSGAGDTVTATLTAAMAAGAEAETAVQLANFAAGVVVAKVGTAIATPAEIIAHARSL